MGATSYEACGPEVGKLILKVMKQYHSALEAAEVTIHAVFAFKSDKAGEPLPAIKKDGHVVVAKIQITPLSDRARGVADAKLTIDRHEWDHISESRKVALLDHEITHLKLKDGELDDLGRPKLKARHHDWHLTGFTSVAERHGEAAVEVREMIRWQEDYGQFALLPLKGTKAVKVKTSVPVQAEPA
jgi:hypothetical protein